MCVQDELLDPWKVFSDEWKWATVDEIKAQYIRLDLPDKSLKTDMSV